MDDSAVDTAVLATTIAQLAAQLDTTKTPAVKRILKGTIAAIYARMMPVLVVREGNVVPFPGGAE